MHWGYKYTMNLGDITRDLQEYANKKVVVEQEFRLHAIWHGFMRAYGYIPYEHFIDRMSCYDTLNLLSELKKESNYINAEKQKLNALRGRL